MSWSAYYENLFRQLMLLFLPPLLKTGIYYGIFKKRGYTATIKACFLAAFLPSIVLIGIPIHIPEILNFFIVIGTGLAILNYFSNVELFPTGLTVVLITEGIFRLLLDLLL